MEIIDGRLKLTLYLMLLSITILVGGLYFCQIYQGDKYIRLAHSNRLRMIRSPAPRGEIFDRNGVPLAINDTTFNIMGYPLDLNTKEKLENLSRILFRHGIPITVEDLEKTIKKQRMMHELPDMNFLKMHMKNLMRMRFLLLITKMIMRKPFYTV